MVTRAESLAGIWAKIDRANSHIDELHVALKAFMERNPYSFLGQEDVEAGEYVFYVQDALDIPIEVSAITGDTLHNIRSALDLLACALVRQQCPSCEDVFFPISWDATSVEKAINKGKIELAGNAVIDIVRGLEPYKTGKGRPLWEIHQLDIIDKHRLPLVASAAIGNSYKITLTEGSGVIDASQPVDSFIEPKKGDEIYRVAKAQIFPMMSKGKLYFELPVDITFNEPSIVLKRQPVLKQLEEYGNFVADVIDKLAPFIPG